MTVFNITQLDKKLAKAIAKYYGVSKVQLTYSDCWLVFAGKVCINKERDQVSDYKREIVRKVLTSRFGNSLEVFNCPQIKSTNLQEGNK